MRATGISMAVCLGLTVAGAGLAACGDAYSTHLPRQKLTSEMILLPDNTRAGQVFELHAVVFTPDEINYISNYDFGPGVEVLNFDTGAGKGCEQVDLTDITAPNLFETTYLFPVCLTMTAESSAELGEREVFLDVESGGDAVIARSAFYLLPALDE